MVQKLERNKTEIRSGPFEFISTTTAFVTFLSDSFRTHYDQRKQTKKYMTLA